MFRPILMAVMSCVSATALAAWDRPAQPLASRVVRVDQGPIANSAYDEELRANERSASDQFVAYQSAVARTTVDRAAADRTLILAGVHEIAAPGVPGPLVVSGERAFVVATGRFGGEGAVAPVVAGSHLGGGRAVAFGHTGYLDAAMLNVADTGTLLANAIRWAAGGEAVSRQVPGDAEASHPASGVVADSRPASEGPGDSRSASDGPAASRPATGDAAVRRPSASAPRIRVGVIGNAPLVDALAALGFDAKEITLAPGGVIERLKQVDVICTGQGALSEVQVAAIQRFVRDGGGLVMAGLGWGWLQLNPGRTLHEHPGNRMLGEAGLRWADGTLERTTQQGFAVSLDTSPDCHAAAALATLEAAAALASHAHASLSPGGDSLGGGNRETTSRQSAATPGGLRQGAATPVNLRQAAATCLLAVRSLPSADTSFLPRVRRLVDDRSVSLVPSKGHPLTADRHALLRVLLAFQIVHREVGVAASVAPHPAASHFPGAVPGEAKRVSRSIDIDLSVPGWQGTGLYAPPGEAIRVQVVDGAAPNGLSVQIGSHTDLLWHHDEWKRGPQITNRTPLSGRATDAVNPFGGLVYLDCPEGHSGALKLRITGAVEAPYYVLNKTSTEDWKQSIRQRPAPWAELESARIIVTVPSAAVRRLDKPEALMEYWDRMADAHATLACIPRERIRPERFVADIQISAGYMHAGYPIMTHLDAVEDMTQLDRLRRGCWGLLHELGHNHQSDDWTFEGTGEVTCNLFTLYAIDTICEPPAGSRGHPAVNKPPSAVEYIRRGAKFDEWKRDPFLALQMYVQLEAAFGWETFQRVFAEYRALPAGERPRTDDEKRDQWMVRFSRACGRNLGPFFVLWGVPTSESARASIAGLPAWLPAELNALEP